MSVVAGAHATLANGRPAMALPVPVFHRQDHASFAWRTGSLGHAASLRFLSPLIEPDMQISSIRLSDKTSRLRPRHVAAKRRQAYESEVPVEVARVDRFRPCVA